MDNSKKTDLNVLDAQIARAANSPEFDNGIGAAADYYCQVARDLQEKYGLTEIMAWRVIALAINGENQQPVEPPVRTY